MIGADTRPPGLATPLNSSCTDNVENMLNTKLENLALRLEKRFDNVRQESDVIRNRVARMEALYICTDPSVDQVLNKLMDEKQANEGIKEAVQIADFQPDAEHSPGKKVLTHVSSITHDGLNGIPECSSTSHELQADIDTDLKKCLYYDITLDTADATTQVDQREEMVPKSCQTAPIKRNRKARCNGKASQTDPLQIRDVCRMHGESDIIFLDSYSGPWESIDDTQTLRIGDAVALGKQTTSSNAAVKLIDGLEGVIRKIDNDTGDVLVFFPEVTLHTLGEHWVSEEDVKKMFIHSAARSTEQHSLEPNLG